MTRGSMGSGSITETATTTQEVFICPDNCTMLLIRAKATNTDEVYIKIDDFTSATDDIVLRAGEYVAFDISSSLSLKMSLGFALQDTDFFKNIAFKSASGSQIIEIDSFGIPMPIIK